MNTIVKSSNGITLVPLETTVKHSKDLYRGHDRQRKRRYRGKAVHAARG